MALSGHLSALYLCMSNRCSVGCGGLMIKVFSTLSVSVNHTYQEQ